MHGISAIGEDIFGLITKHGYLGFFGLMAVEEAGVPLPIPGDLLLVFVGYKIFAGKMVLWKAILTTMAATSLGSTFLYTVFKFGGRPLAKKYGKYILLSEERLKSLEVWFEKKGKWAVILGRFLPYARVFISAVAGLSGLKFVYFLPQVALASFLWALGFITLGIVMGKRWRFIFEGSKTGSFIFLLIFVIVIGVFIYRENKKAKLKLKEAKSKKILVQG